MKKSASYLQISDGMNAILLQVPSSLLIFLNETLSISEPLTSIDVASSSTAYGVRLSLVAFFYSTVLAKSLSTCYLSV